MLHSLSDRATDNVAREAAEVLRIEPADFDFPPRTTASQQARQP